MAILFIRMVYRNMINSIYDSQQVNFKGKSFSKKGFKECEDCCEKTIKKYKKAAAETYRAYFIKSYPQLEKSMWGYKVPVNSQELKSYSGIMKKTAGFSTEAGGYGGGWIKSNIDTPLSTKDVHTCALLNLVNENTGEQMIYHVFDHTNSAGIKELIKNEFPRFTKANILPGDQHQTNNTVNNIIDAIDDINPKVLKQYYHMPVENPEIVAIGGELRYIENLKPDIMTFTEITNQYHY